MESNLFKSFAKGKKKITNQTNECVIYTRVSGAKQMEGLSLETQLKGTDAYATKHNLIVREYFGGTYESAATDERKEFQRMIKYLKSTKSKISKILVYSLERFSRNENSIWLSSQLRDLGMEVVSVTQPIDTSCPSGIMQQKMLFLFGEFDNQLRRQKSMAGMRERLLKGEWCAKPPIGYDIVRTNGERKIVLNDTGKIIKKIFLWKANERLPNMEIIKRLANYKLKVTSPRINEILSNPFYCGMISHKALEGEVIEGKQERLITKEIFLQVNGILSEKKLGLQTKEERKEIALKRFVRCKDCNQRMRGYVSTKWLIPYYKCNSEGCKNNRNANHVNEKFHHLLSEYKIDEKYNNLIKEQLYITFQQHNESIIENQSAAKLRIEEIAKKLERLEERFITEEINSELYHKYKAKFEQEIDEIGKEITQNIIEMSKLEDFISYSLNFCGNLTEMWASGDYTQRQELQNAFFENGITYNRETDECRSNEPNLFLTCVRDLSRDLRHFVNIENKNFVQNNLGTC